MAKLSIQIPEELRDLSPAYLESRIKDLARLKDALTRKDFDFIAGLSHKTKGTAASYGFEQLGAIAKSLEFAAKSQNLADLETALAAMAEYLGNVEIQL